MMQAWPGSSARSALLSVLRAAAGSLGSGRRVRVAKRSRATRRGDSRDYGELFATARKGTIKGRSGTTGTTQGPRVLIPACVDAGTPDDLGFGLERAKGIGPS
jgi:hypothetical protein